MGFSRGFICRIISNIWKVGQELVTEEGRRIDLFIGQLLAFPCQRIAIDSRLRNSLMN